MELAGGAEPDAEEEGEAAGLDEADSLGDEAAGSPDGFAEPDFLEPDDESPELDGESPEPASVEFESLALELLGA